MRLLICAGGTGGGVYPALAVHNALKTSHPDVETLWVGGEGGMETALVERAAIPFKAIPAAGLHGVDFRQLPGNIQTLVRGVTASRRILAEFQPDVLFFTGGYVAAPMALAGRKIPSLLYVPDIEPGLALKALAYFATRITLTASESRKFFSRKAKVFVTGYPVRAELAKWDKKSGRKTLGIKSDLPVLLVLGGSKGARSINLALFEHLDHLLAQMEVIHISGETDWEMALAACTRLPKDLSKRYHAYSYLHHEMGAALAAADLAVSRSGASTLGEYPFFGLPALLVPYPYAWRYQKVNAEALANHGAALVIEDAKLKSGLYLTVEKLLETPEKLEDMRQAMRALSVPDAAAQIAAHLMELAGAKHD
ncbi:MAG: UDP-N-acetylglucosamine--N-acetylmuramyl-(pentapeptide) pyrophosphoryl-undecaprenol N-acetylglucosamine transferase [Anaerolineales bacterium]